MESPCTLINPAAVTIHRHIFTKQSLEKKGWKERKSERETEKERDSKGVERGKKWGKDAALWANLRNKCWCISYWLCERSW